MKKTLYFFSIFVFVLPVVAYSAAPVVSPEQILRNCDDVRLPNTDYRMLVEVEDYKADDSKRIALYEVLVKGRDKTLIKTLKPKIDRGTTLLMLKYDLWVYMKIISKPLRISLRQRLFGQVANGDIARANFSGDYDPTLLRQENLNGREYYVLNLAAKNNKVTYQKVILWVDKENYHPLKAEFYAVSGKLLKTCEYKNFRKMMGKMRPTLLVLKNPLSPKEYSLLKYLKMESAKLPDRYFSRDYLRRLRY